MKISELPVDFSVVWNGNFIIDNPENIKGKNKRCWCQYLLENRMDAVIFGIFLLVQIFHFLWEVTKAFVCIHVKSFVEYLRNLKNILLIADYLPVFLLTITAILIGMFTVLPMSSHSALVQVCSPAGQLRHVSKGREEIPVWLVQWWGKVYTEAPLPPHQPLHNPLAEPVQQECEVYQPTHHWGQYL